MDTTAQGDSSPTSGRFQGYTPDEMVATNALTRAEDPRWRWLFPVTRSTRDYFTSRFPVLVVSYTVAVGLIFVAARIEGLVPLPLIYLWLAESVANFTIRSLLTAVTAAASPVQVAKRPSLRLLPLVAIVLAALHWSWTATLFIGTSLDLTTLVVLLAFVMLSIACIGLAPASPMICIVYLVPIWSVTAYKLFHTEWANNGALVVLLAALAAILWPAFYLIVSGVRRNLLRSDEVDLLVTQLRDRNAEVEGLRHAAAGNLETRSAFFASASHDFRQRVHAMKLLAQSALDENRNRHVDSSPLSRLASVIEDLESYMTDVLEFSRLERTPIAPARNLVKLQKVFQDVDIQFESIAAAKQVDFRVRPTSLVLCTDAAMLTRVLENLVSNAIKFTGKRVLLTARRRRHEVDIEVRDQGPGIPMDCLESVFEPFNQGGARFESARQGVGLGLSIVKRVADALGYRIQVHTRAGRGTCMCLTVPEHDLVA